nr:hypothetical protein [uncultured bacterium]
MPLSCWRLYLPLFLKKNGTRTTPLSVLMSEVIMPIYPHFLFTTTSSLKTTKFTKLKGGMRFG